MLILTRRAAQKSPRSHEQSVIYIGDDVAIAVLGISDTEVRLGIEAPTDVLVSRHELVVRGGDRLPSVSTRIFAAIRKYQPGRPFRRDRD